MTDSVLIMVIPLFERDSLQLAYVQVADHIAARIDAGELAAGSRLPPERDLAEEYGVAYNTLRQAMNVLRDRGLVVTLRDTATTWRGRAKAPQVRSQGCRQAVIFCQVRM